MELLTVLVIAVVATALAMGTNHFLNKLFYRYGFKFQSFFVFYILFPGLMALILIKVYAESGEPINYLQIAKYVAILWVAMGSFQLLDKLFKGSAIFHCIMAIIIILGMMSIPFIFLNASQLVQ